MMLPKLVAELWESSTTHSVYEIHGAGFQSSVRGAGFQSSAIDTVQVLRNHSQWSINQSIPMGSADYKARSVLVNPTSLDGELGGGTSYVSCLAMFLRNIVRHDVFPFNLLTGYN